MHTCKSGHNLFMVLAWCFVHQPTRLICLRSGKLSLFWGSFTRSVSPPRRLLFAVLAIKPPTLPACFAYQPRRVSLSLKLKSKLDVGV